MMQTKSRVLLVGAGSVGTMSAYALETGGKAAVTAVFRSNYEAVNKNGIDIDSIEYGNDIRGWRPTEIRNTIPNVTEEGIPPFDYILVTTKNIPDVPPTVADLIAPAVTPGKTAIVLSQNGLNIEKPLIPRFPTNPLISSIQYIGATEVSHGKIVHKHLDVQKISPFDSPQVPAGVAAEAAKRYLSIYNPDGKLGTTYEPSSLPSRWRKLLYNSSYNSVSTALHMDTARMRMCEHVIDDLVRPIMFEIIAAAKACGIDIPESAVEDMIRDDPTDSFFKPSMCQDMEKGNLMEIESIIGAPLREGEAHGVSMPTLKVIYGCLKGLQVHIKEAKGLWEPKYLPGNPYSESVGH